jgi:uronate dehydrogenase
MDRVLITGAAGHIGDVLRRGLRGRHALVRLLDIAPLRAAETGEELCTVDIGDLGALEQAMDGIDCVVHLAGIPDEAEWDLVLPRIIVGTYNTFEAARRRGVKRFVYASSNHAVGFYRRERVLDDTALPRPDGRYGAAKVFGEALGRLYADKHGMSVACLRIGTFRTPDRPAAVRHLSTWISHRDMVQLVSRCIDHPHYHFLVAYGVSDNARRCWDNKNIAFLGYRPQDNAEAFAGEVLAEGVAEDDLEAQFHGGPLCSIDFSGDPSLIE